MITIRLHRAEPHVESSIVRLLFLGVPSMYGCRYPLATTTQGRNVGIGRIPLGHVPHVGVLRP